MVEANSFSDRLEYREGDLVQAKGRRPSSFFLCDLAGFAGESHYMLASHFGFAKEWTGNDMSDGVSSIPARSFIGNLKFDD